MAYKAFLLAALIACVRAGGPAAYSISAPSGDHAYVGSSQEHTVKGHYGQNSNSQYSNAIDSAHSSVRVSSSSYSNDALGYAPHYGAAHIAAPAVAHYAAPAAVAHYAAPAAVAHYAAPAIAHHAYAAPALRVAAAPAIAHAYAPAHHYGTHLAAPAFAAHHGFAAPAAVKFAAPAVSYAHAASPLYAHAAAPLAYGHGFAAAPHYAAGHYGGYAAAHYAAPHFAAGPHYASSLAVKTVAAAPLVHTSFAGHGAHFAY